MSDSTVLSYNMLLAFVERDAEGALDFDATVTKFAVRLTEFRAAVEMESDAIATAVNSVFDRWTPGAAINMDAIVGMSLPGLNPTPENHNILRDRIKEYVRLNADRHEKKSKEGVVLAVAEPPRTRAFVIAKGKGGGVRRWSDVAEKPAE